MNSKQKIHQLRLEQWAARFKEQTASGLTAKQWCFENNLSIHSYNYWKHLIKEQYVDSVIPDIVPLSLDSLNDYPAATTPSCISNDSHELHEICDNSVISIRINGCLISVNKNVSEALLTTVIKAVKHA